MSPPHARPPPLFPGKRRSLPYVVYFTGRRFRRRIIDDAIDTPFFIARTLPRYAQAGDTVRERVWVFAPPAFSPTTRAAMRHQLIDNAPFSLNRSVAANHCNAVAHISCRASAALRLFAAASIYGAR